MELKGIRVRLEKGVVGKGSGWKRVKLEKGEGKSVEMEE